MRQLTPEYSSIKDTRFLNILTWSPNPLQLLANNRNNIDLQDAKKRLYKTPWGAYQYTPSSAYMRHLAKLGRGNIHGILWGKTF